MLLSVAPLATFFGAVFSGRLFTLFGQPPRTMQLIMLPSACIFVVVLLVSESQFVKAVALMQTINCTIFEFWFTKNNAKLAKEYQTGSTMPDFRLKDQETQAVFDSEYSTPWRTWNFYLHPTKTVFKHSNAYFVLFTWRCSHYIIAIFWILPKDLRPPKYQDSSYMCDGQC